MKTWIALLMGLALVAGGDLALARESFKGGAPAGHIGAPPSGGASSGHSGGFRGHPGFVHSRPFFQSRIIIGGPLFVGPPVYPYYYYPPYYPPAYAEQPQYLDPNTTYIEQPSNGAPEQQYFYYCPDSRAYYPNVTSCPSPWMKVLP